MGFFDNFMDMVLYGTNKTQEDFLQAQAEREDRLARQGLENLKVYALIGGGLLIGVVLVVLAIKKK